MIKQQYHRIQVGDWVSGHSKNNYVFRGFVEAVSEIQESVLVRIVHSERESKSGKVIECALSRIEWLDEEVLDEMDYRALIELALQTRDEHWFLEITNHLKQSMYASSKLSQKLSPKGKYSSRF